MRRVLIAPAAGAVRVVAACVLGAALTTGGVARAATFTVDSLADEQDAAAGDGACVTASGACTLRAAVMEANALAGADEIVLGPGTHVIALPGAGEDAGLSGDLDVLDELSIVGAGMDVSIVSAAALDRVLDVHATALTARGLTLRDGLVPLALRETGGGNLRVTEGAVTLDRLRLANGRVEDDALSEVWGGGGLLSVSSVAHLQDCVVSGNDATLSSRGGAGGGVLSDDTPMTGPPGTISLSRCVIEGNASAVGGGIIVRSGTLDQCTIRANRAGRAGGLWLVAGAVTGSAIVENQAIATDGGELCGGLIVEAATVTNVTISGNVAESMDGLTGLCGGACTWWSGSSRFAHVTITGNRAVLEGGGYCDVGAPTQSISSSVIVGNQAPRQPDVRRYLGLAGPVLVGDTTGITPYGDVSMLRTGNAALLPLADNGGPTPTHALAAGSDAIDAVDAPCLQADGTPATTDQRGFSRPADGDADGVSRCDLGALEAGAVAPADADGDTVPDAADCAPSDPTTWLTAGEPRVDVTIVAGDARLEWNDVLAGTAASSAWDVASGSIAALHAGDMTTECLARGWLELTYVDARATAPPGSYYLVRPASACSPGWGSSSLGVPRSACP